MKSQEEKIRQMLEELGQALAQAIQDSPSISETLEEISQDGYALHLVLGCMDDLESMAQASEVAPESPTALPSSTQPSAALPSAAPAALPSAAALPSSVDHEAPPPSFRVNAKDVGFFKSIGIDPTRAVRRRRKPRSLA